MKTISLFLVALLGWGGHVAAQPGATETPLAVVKRIGDKLIRDTPFRYQLVPRPVGQTFNGLHVVDFGRSLTLGKPAVAYAYTHLTSPQAQTLTMQVEHNDGCKIWLNGQVVYEKEGDHSIKLEHEERSIELPNQLQLTLKEGANQLLIKSETRGNEWRVYLQPPSQKGAILAQKITYPAIGLANVPDVDPRVAKMTNWLIMGPFANPTTANARTGLRTAYGPEKEIRFGRMYVGLDSPVTWTIPKVDVLGDLIDSKEWGTNYHWNYHNGGVAWAMQHLAELSGQKQYDEYASRFCDFQLESIPFVSHQVGALNAVTSANYHLVNTPLLDFTLAPSIPFVYRLRQQPTFARRSEYVQFIDKMLHYAQNEQLRLPGSGIYTRTTPEKYTTWVDDMFMGIPFLVQASRYVTDPAQKKAFLDDAASQVMGFNEQVWDADANLYMHARYSNRPAKLPHWSRANGWAVWAMSEVLMNLPADHPRYKPILNHFRKHMESLARLQDKSGFWLNVLDRPDSPREVSGTAIFAMGMARGIQHGWLDAKRFKPAVMNAWDALKTQIDPDGTVHNICMGTMCSEDVNYYLTRPFYDNDTHGLFAVLFAGIEIEKMLNNQPPTQSGR
ncbi:glycoside hydrolase family 88/105 protein [Rudanella lutea]|uniref:glycoside hydrolase family 88/105 protein n=1 Tax=Rudanella lutea TaxID=451374 RepID=UPI000364B172|nr:glycoside hydrolase family 88 protein [Rudanella lutea]